MKLDLIINSIIYEDDEMILKLWVEKGLHLKDGELYMNHIHLNPSILVNDKDFEKLKEKIVYLSRENNLKNL